MNILIPVTAFLSGFITLSLEIMGFRVLAPHFGYSIYVFGSLIGLILCSFAVGYWAGGFLSHKGIGNKKFFSIILIAGLYLAVMSYLYSPLLGYLSSMSIVEGTLLASFIIWAFPMAAFASVSPYLVGLHSENEHPGRSSGWVSATGTIGSLVGTFLTSFLLLPKFGTQITFVINVYVALAVPLMWFLFSRSKSKWMLGIFVLPLILQGGYAAKLSSGVVHAEESAYSRLEVVNYGTFLGLRTENRTGTVYSIMPKDGSMPQVLLYNLFSVPALANDSKRGLLLGLGAGTLPRIHEILNPKLELQGVEIDSKVVDIGKKFFGLNEMKNIKGVAIADARPFLAQEENKYDLIEMDIFHSTEMPFYLVSKEFFQLAKSKLNDNGVFMMNIYDPSPERRIEKRVANSAAAVYPYLYVTPAGLGSYFMAGSMHPLELPAKSQITDPRLAAFAQYFTDNTKLVLFSEDEEVFTDDRAPIEMLVATAKSIPYNK